MAGTELDPGKGRVLVVDDELTLARAYARSLENAGHDVVTTTDGVNAGELCERESFDVILTDVWMPGLTGLELLRSVRRRDGTVQVVLLTAAPKAGDADTAAAEGALMYLAKPLDLRVVVQVVEHGCRLRRAMLRRAAEKVA